MSYTADPAFDAAVHEDEQDARAMRNEAHQTQVEVNAARFVNAVMTRDLHDATGFTTRIEYGINYERVPGTVADMMVDALECGQQFEQGLVEQAQVIKLCAAKGDIDAVNYLNKLATAWATEHVEVAL